MIFFEEEKHDSFSSRMVSYAAEITQEYRQTVNIVSAILCVIIADAVLQLLFGPGKARQENRVWAYDYWRCAHLVVVTALLAILGYQWYNLLDDMYVTSAAKDVAAKVVLDEIIMAPFVITSYIFALGLLEGQDLNSVYLEWAEKFTPIFQTDLLVWPAVQVVNYLAVPAPLRVHFINACTFLWNLYLIEAKHATASKHRVFRCRVPGDKQRGDPERLTRRGDR